MRVKELKKILKKLDPETQVAVLIRTKQDMEQVMEVSMTDHVWNYAVANLPISQELIDLQLRQACWDAEYDSIPTNKKDEDSE